MNFKNDVEILAPAGSYESMVAAMNAGCDAVYMGGSSFGARAYANNFYEDALLDAINEAHIRGKNVYLTVNTLVKEKEMQESIYDFLKKPYINGLDAVIVQDLGVLKFVHDNFPELPIHISTQGTVFTGQALDLLKGYGVTRLVTPRELSLEEIRAIRERTDIEIETFVHGALCYSYSGQCLMSSLIGGRSGNRGQCAQPCRMAYEFHEKDRLVSNLDHPFLLSPKDISTISLIPEMIEVGISSFKIEGRMKGPEYVALAVSLFRKYIDLYYKVGKEEYKNIIGLGNGEYEKDLIALQDVYSRGEFSQGYLKTYSGKNMMSMNRPNHSGVLVGQVKDIKNNQIIMEINRDLNAQDVLEIRYNNQKHFEFTVKDFTPSGKIIQVNISRKKLKNKRPTNENIFHGGLAQAGDEIYRTRNNSLLERTKLDYLGRSNQEKLKIRGKLIAHKGKELELIITKGENIVKALHNQVEKALKQPIAKERVVEQLNKTGNSSYKFEEIEVVMDDDIFIPISNLNEIRRNGLRLIEDKVISSYYREVPIRQLQNPTDCTDVGKAEPDNFPGMVVSIQTAEQWNIVISNEMVKAIYLDIEFFEVEEVISFAKEGKENSKDIYIMLPHICRQNTYDDLKKNKLPYLDDNIKGYIAKNLEEVHLIKEIAKDKEIILNHNLYIFNKEGYGFWEEQGVYRFTAALELNSRELKGLTISNSDLIVYGYQPAMISAQCIFKNTVACKKDHKDFDKTGYLLDRKKEKFIVQANCEGCYNIIYNSKATLLVDEMDEILKLNPRNIRLDFTTETKEDIKDILVSFESGRLVGRSSDDFTKGHFKRGVL